MGRVTYWVTAEEVVAVRKYVGEVDLHVCLSRRHTLSIGEVQLFPLLTHIWKSINRAE